MLAPLSFYDGGVQSVYTAFPEARIIGSILQPVVRQGSHFVLTDDLDPCVSLHVASQHLVIVL
jgi:hypothetical protein